MHKSTLQRTAQHHQLTKMLCIVVCHKKHFAQKGLTCAMRDLFVKLCVRGFRQGNHLAEVG